jgi:CRISPR-associated endonuclease/helicase Cas3
VESEETGRTTFVDGFAWAHSGNASGEPQPLDQHLSRVADLAKSYALAFDGSEAAEQLGLWHDIGKFSSSFQRYLRLSEASGTRTRGPDHKRAGALLAQNAGFSPGSLIIQGHHGGLREPAKCSGWLGEHAGDPDVEESLSEAERVLGDAVSPVRPIAIPDFARIDPASGELFIRFLFSALVDADYLDTERHFDPTKRNRRLPERVSLRGLWARFAEYHAKLTADSIGPVNEIRREVYEACLEAAAERQGLFRLTVPTGGGKTLSGLAFALRHAVEHGLERVIIAVPFISITEQTASVVRDALGDHGDPEEPIVLEHHSGVIGDENDEGDSETGLWQRLAAENWDAPVIVTTTVQLFESLFASRPSACRKIHRLAKSVILIDEAQALPSRLLEPVLDALSQLCSNYGSSVVLSTATQPAFEKIEDFSALDAREIAPDPESLFRRCRRVEYEWQNEEDMSWNEIASLATSEAQALVVLNTKADAMAMLDALGETEALHLSTLLCGAHRRAVIEDVRRRLERGRLCLLVSTQVVEAGVDLDFPLVVRAMGPLDSIIQAAGRCNREGRLERGRVVIVRTPDDRMPPGSYRTAAGVTAAALGKADADPNDPTFIRGYYERLIPLLETDTRSIQNLRRSLRFDEVSRRFRMIDDDTEEIVVPYGGRDSVSAGIARLRHGGFDARGVIRRLHPYLVSVRRREADRLRAKGLVSEVLPGLDEWLGVYDAVRGIGGARGIDPERLVI